MIAYERQRRCGFPHLLLASWMGPSPGSTGPWSLMKGGLCHPSQAHPMRDAQRPSLICGTARLARRCCCNFPSRAVRSYVRPMSAVARPLAMMISVMLDRLIKLTRSNAQRGKWSDQHWNSPCGSSLQLHLAAHSGALAPEIWKVVMRAILPMLVRNIRPCSSEPR